MRHEGDSWDIASSVGRTALGIATFRALESERPDRLACDEFARRFVEAAGEQHFLDILANPPAAGDFSPLQLVIGPRTRFFDEYFESATAAGAVQAVILASGLDSRAFRLNWPSGTTVFEIDQPAVLEFKDQVLADRGALPTAERRTVAVDLRDDWLGALEAAGFDRSVPTAWSAEGLLNYLPGVAQDALFKQITATAVAGSHLAVNPMPPLTDFPNLPEADVQRIDHDLFGGQSSELRYTDERNDPVQWLGQHGWTVNARNIVELISDYGRQLPDLKTVPAELFALGERVLFVTATRS